MFEELVKHINVQKVEADELRSRISTAAQDVMQAEIQVSSQLESVLNEERAQAAQDRQELLSQISSLVTKSGEAQDARWQSKINDVRSDIMSSRSVFENEEKKYSESMDLWSKKENSLVEEVITSRDALKSRMKMDWTVSCPILEWRGHRGLTTAAQAVNERNTAIQTTTKSVHEETIRIVDAQMKDMATQMQALDDFVTRARSQNERHHSTHVSSLRSLALTVNDSYSSIGDHFSSSYDRVRDVGNDISVQSKALEDALPPLAETVQQPLSSLRSTITNAPLKEYVPTGETPQKINYRFPTTLPRTEPHDKVLTKLFPAKDNNSTTASLIPPPSPCKSIVYTDTPTTSTGSPTKTPTPSKATTMASGIGLREIDMNITNNTSARHSDPSLLGKPAADHAFNTSMGPPPLKRQATVENSRLPQKLGQGKTGGGIVRVEGRENLGAGRRLRSSPTG